MAIVALARKLADEWRLSVDQTVREALQARQCAPPVPRGQALSAEMIETRKTTIRRIVAEIAALPELDTRSIREIRDDLNPL